MARTSAPKPTAATAVEAPCDAEALRAAGAAASAEASSKLICPSASVSPKAKAALPCTSAAAPPAALSASLVLSCATRTYGRVQTYPDIKTILDTPAWGGGERGAGAAAAAQGVSQAVAGGGGREGGGGEAGFGCGAVEMGSWPHLGRAQLDCLLQELLDGRKVDRLVRVDEVGRDELDLPLGEVDPLLALLRSHHRSHLLAVESEAQRLASLVLDVRPVHPGVVLGGGRGARRAGLAPRLLFASPSRLSAGTRPEHFSGA
mmetsp:Transcript_45618/g.148267  ORF Transcript_45618/g.148267 Transcript_45618/m.148267 type:complete len:261 (+) Transcript_45618:294-1076(+)